MSTKKSDEVTNETEETTEEVADEETEETEEETEEESDETEEPAEEATPDPKAAKPSPAAVASTAPSAKPSSPSTAARAKPKAKARPAHTCTVHGDGEDHSATFKSREDALRFAARFRARHDRMLDVASTAVASGKDTERWSKRRGRAWKKESA